MEIHKRRLPGHRGHSRAGIHHRRSGVSRLVRLPVARRTGAAESQPLYAAALGGGDARHHRRSPGRDQGLQQVRNQDQADLDRLVSLGGADEGRRSHAAVGSAAHEPDSRHRREEPVRHRRALCDLRPTAGRGDEARTEHQHHRRGQLHLGGGERLRLFRRRAVQLSHWATTPTICWARSGSRPAGEIIRTGSLSSGCGWFCSEGPGPSLRGITRGVLGSRGGLGTYTKCAIKLAHWPGPPTLEPQGPPPGYRLPVPDNMRAYTIGAPNWDAWAECYYAIYDNEIGYIFHRQFNLAGADLAPALWLTYIDPAKTLNDVETAAKDPGVTQDHRGVPHLVPVDPGGKLGGGDSTAGQDSGRHPRTDRLLQGEALLRTGHGRIHQHVHAAAGPQALQLHLGGRLHGKLDAGRYAGFREELHSGCDCRASTATRRAICWWNAAATP